MAVACLKVERDFTGYAEAARPEYNMDHGAKAKLKVIFQREKHKT